MTPYCVVDGVTVYKRSDGALQWTSKAAVDGDGSPRCYHPDSKSGLDYLRDAGSVGNWFGIATNGAGDPYLQGINAPAYEESTKGFFVSTTALAANPNLPANDPRRYVNAEEVAYIVVPGGKEFDHLLGKHCEVTYNGKTISAIVADRGPHGEIGEISIKAAQLLEINHDCRHGGVNSGVTYVVYA